MMRILYEIDYKDFAGVEQTLVRRFESNGKMFDEYMNDKLQPRMVSFNHIVELMEMEEKEI